MNAYQQKNYNFPNDLYDALCRGFLDHISFGPYFLISLPDSICWKIEIEINSETSTKHDSKMLYDENGQFHMQRSFKFVFSCVLFTFHSVRQHETNHVISKY